MRSALIKLTFLFSALALVVGASPIASAQQPISVKDIDQLSEEQLQDWIGKLNGHTKLLNASLRAVSAWSRYRSWVNIKTGPTGKESIIYGLYSVSQSTAQSALETARKAYEAEPRISPLDEASQRYAADFEALAPVLIEAEGYYERKDYKDDKMAKGKELHAKLVPLFEAFLKDRELLEKELKIVKTAVDQKQLAFIEKREGKSYAWHTRRVMMHAAIIADILSDEEGKEQMTHLDETIPTFAKVVKEFDEYIASPNAAKHGVLDSQPRSFLGNVRDYRDDLESDPSSAQTNLQFLISEYNTMVQMSSINVP